MPGALLYQLNYEGSQLGVSRSICWAPAFVAVTDSIAKLIYYVFKEKL